MALNMYNESLWTMEHSTKGCSVALMENDDWRLFNITYFGLGITRSRVAPLTRFGASNIQQGTCIFDDQHRSRTQEPRSLPILQKSCELTSVVIDVLLALNIWQAESDCNHSSPIAPSVFQPTMAPSTLGTASRVSKRQAGLQRYATVSKSTKARIDIEVALKEAKLNLDVKDKQTTKSAPKRKRTDVQDGIELESGKVLITVAKSKKVQSDSSF